MRDPSSSCTPSPPVPGLYLSLHSLAVTASEKHLPLFFLILLVNCPRRVLLSLRVGFGQQHERAAHQLRKKMAAEAVGLMSRGANGGRAAELVTRDFLGGCAGADDASRDAARQQHDATPGKLSSLPKHACPRDLNLFPVATPCHPATTTYHSVCTIEKVKTALARFERGGASPSSSSVTTSSVKRRGGADGAVEQGDGCDSPSGGGGMVAAACPRCFLYVLISRSDPRCPRCEAHVPAPPQAVSKKPRIDLNVGYLGT